MAKTKITSGSFYAISEKRVKQQVGAWNIAMSGIKPYYAVKCNPEPLLLKWLSESNVGFDCASAREIEAVKTINPEADIIFANPCKKREDIYYAIKNGVTTTVVDSIEEIDKLAECQWSDKSLIRIRVEDSGSKMPFGAKFGADPATVTDLLTYAKAKKQQISGISFHVGSGCEDPLQYRSAIRLASKMGAQAADTIDIGGGFTNDGFHKAADQIQKARGFIPSKTVLIAEPGRFFAATSHDLFVRVIGKKRNIDQGYRYTLDESLYGQFSCIPFDQAQPKWIRVRCEGEPRRMLPGILYGRTCDSVDTIAKSPAMEELMEGDWLWFPNMGAYTTATSTEFNGFPKPPVLELDDLPNSQDFLWPDATYVSHVKVT